MNSDNIYGRKEYRDLSENITAASVSADGNRLAVTARGEVFDIPAKQGVVKNITRSPGANDRGAQISPDGKYIAYISDKTGETEVWLQEETGGEPSGVQSRGADHRGDEASCGGLRSVSGALLPAAGGRR